MSYYPDYDRYSTSRYTDGYSYSRHAVPLTTHAAHGKLTDVGNSVNRPRSKYPPPSPPSPPYRSYPLRTPTWPPSASVEDETTALAKEVGPAAGSEPVADHEPPTNTRGTVDQEALLEDIQPPPPPDTDERRFVLVSEPATYDDSKTASTTASNRRRKSFAERANMAAHRLTTDTDVDVDDPPVFTKRTPTPYAYTPADQNAKPSKTLPVGTRHDSLTRSAPTAKNDVLDESDVESEDTTRLRAERKPARYSFVKSHVHREHARTDLGHGHAEPEREGRRQHSTDGRRQHSIERRRRDSRERAATIRHGHDASSASSTDNSHPHSPRSSSSSLNNGSRKARPVPVDTIHANTSRPCTRPSSPAQRASSPQLPSRLRESPASSRPSSRGHTTTTRPSTPLSFSTTVRPPSPDRSAIIDADWHATYPPFAAATDRPRPPSRYGRHETMPVPAPRTDVKNPSPARPHPPDNSLPYPVDDRATHAFMPFEEHYKFDRSVVASPRQTYSDSPRVSSSSIPGTPRDSNAAFRPPVPKHDPATLQGPSRARRSRSNSVSSRSSLDGRRERFSRTPAPPNLDKPLPSCPRAIRSAKYNDWYTLKGYRNFDICPTCYEDVFADTPFAVHFSQTRLYDRPTERLCDFSSPWTRLAWLLTIKQRRQSLQMLYALADIAESERPCPGDREVGSDRVSWYGIPDQRDGIHVANFTICSCDVKMIEVLFPTMRGYFTRLPTTYPPTKSLCSLRITSRRFPKYLDLLVELDAEAQSLGQRPNINRFIQLARDSAFKGECGKDKSYFRKPWHFIPSLPEFTVCEECYAELVWPAMQSQKSTIPRLFTKTIQLVPQEDADVGSSCALYSARMRRAWETSLREDDFTYLKRKAGERKRAEIRLGREKLGIMGWMAGTERGGREWDRARRELADVEREWELWE